jgi:hypothetical protein
MPITIYGMACYQTIASYHHHVHKNGIIEKEYLKFSNGEEVSLIEAAYVIKRNWLTEIPCVREQNITTLTHRMETSYE